ncbi:MAG: glycosyltransferase family 2 protein [Candidatus Limnocylindrales bacterium]
MSAEPLVSILTPSFQQAAWLSDNLRSVAHQTYGRLEHIVMDGGSTDGTREILQQAADPRLQWVSEPDHGQAHALNKAFARSSGEIIGWLNSDDAYFSAEVVADAVALFKRRPDVGVVYGHAALVNADGLVLQLIWAPPFSRRLLKLHDFIAQPAAFIRRAALGPSLVDESFDFTMDYDLWLRLAGRHRFARLGRIAAIDRHHGARKSTTMLSTMDGELTRLGPLYGLPVGPAAEAARRVWKVTARCIGTTLILPALRTELVFDGARDGAARLLVRQIATRRASMPVMGRP